MFGGLFGGGFAGIDKKNIGNLTAALKAYRTKIQAQISEFNANADLSNTMAGEDVKAAVTGYLEDAKFVLQEWIDALEKEEQRAETAFDDWAAKETGVAGNVSSDASALRSSAANISLD